MTLGSLSLSDLTRRPWSQPPGGRPASGGALGSRAKVPSGHQGAEAPRRGTRLPLRRADWTLPDKPAEGTRWGAPDCSPAAWMALRPLSQPLLQSLLKLSQTACL